MLRANGRTLRDVIDWRWEADGLAVEVVMSSAGEEHAVSLTRTPGESWGLDFAEAVFDGVITCQNACAFCFMAQLPRGLRPSLYLRDDDYRLSFLQGNFITLTNIGPDEMDRIVEQHLSPLYVSLHAVTPDIRAALVCAREDRALDVMDGLLSSGIDVHVQIVLVPGVNDGEELERTLTWLAEREGVRSVGVVPLGYTRHQSRFRASYEDTTDAQRVLEQLTPWREAFRERDGITWVHAADEFYLNAGVSVPPAADYDGFPQYENGIGLVRAFSDSLGVALSQASGEVGARTPDSRRAVITGTLFAPVLRTLLEQGDLASSADVVAVRNDFFGGNVSVTGLLAGSDILEAIRQTGSERCYLLPGVVFNDDGLTLDGLTLEGIRDRSGASIYRVGSDAESLLSAIL